MCSFYCGVAFLIELFLLWLYFCLSSFYRGYISVGALSIVVIISVGAILMVAIYQLFFFSIRLYLYLCSFFGLHTFRCVLIFDIVVIVSCFVSVLTFLKPLPLRTNGRS